MSVKRNYDQQLTIEDETNGASNKIDLVVEILDEILPAAKITGSQNHTFIIITNNEEELKNFIGASMVNVELNVKSATNLLIMEQNFKDQSAKDIIRYLLLHEIGHINTNGVNIEALDKYRAFNESERVTDEKARELGKTALKNELLAEKFAFEQLDELQFDLSKLKDFFTLQVQVIDETYRGIGLNPFERIEFIRQKVHC